MVEKGTSSAPKPKLTSYDTQGHHDQSETLPHYSGDLRATGSRTLCSQPLFATPGLPNVNVLAYLPTNATLSSDHTTVTVPDKELVTVSTALVSFIRAQAALPPRPILRIRAMIFGNVEFDFKIDMMRYLVRKNDESAWNYTKIIDKDVLGFRGQNNVSLEPHYDTLLEWAQQFVESSARNKS